MDCFVAALLAMTSRHAFAISRPDSPELCQKFSLPSKQRAQGTPGARCTRGLVCKVAQKNAHEHTGSAEAIRHSLRNGLRLITCSPRCTGLDSHRRPRALART